MDEVFTAAAAVAGSALDKLWHKLISPSMVRLEAPLLAMALVYLGQRAWRRAGRTVWGRAVRWWLVSVPVALLLGAGLYLLAVAPEDPEAQAALRAEPERLGRAMLPPAVALAGATLTALTALAASWQWRQGRAGNAERAALGAEWPRRKRRLIRIASVASLAAALAAVTAGAVAAIAPPSVPASEAVPPGMTLWVGTPQGASRLDPGSPAPAWMAAARPWVPLPSNRVISVASSSRGDVLLGTAAGMARYRAAEPSGWWEVYRAGRFALPGLQVFAIAADAQGTAWLATDAGGAAIDSSGGTWAFTSRNAPLLHNILDAVIVDRAGRVWFGGAGGVNVYHPSPDSPGDGEWLVGFTRTSSNGGLPDDLVFTIFEDSIGRIWFGTASGAAVFIPDAAAFGLGAYDRSRWQTFTTANAPLLHGNVHAVAEDRQGRIWLGTKGGINILDGRDPAAIGRWQRLTATGSAARGNDLPHPWVQALSTGPDGRVWAGTRRGLAVYDPAQPAQGWQTYHANALRRRMGALWPAFWRHNVISDEITALAWTRR